MRALGKTGGFFSRPGPIFAKKSCLVKELIETKKQKRQEKRKGNRREKPKERNEVKKNGQTMLRRGPPGFDTDVAGKWKEYEHVAVTLFPEK